MKTPSAKYRHREEENEIYASYCKGEKRRSIKHRFNISDTQFVKIIFNKLKRENKNLTTKLLSELNMKEEGLNKSKGRGPVKAVEVMKFINRKEKE